MIFTVIMVLLGGLAMFGYAKHKQRTTYTADRFLLISHNVTSYSRNENYPIVNADLNMMTSYEDIVENQLVAQKAKQYLPKKIRKDYSVNSISDSISAKSRPQSLVLRVSAKTNNAGDSVKLVNAVTKSFQKELPKLQPGAGNVHLLAKATKADVYSNTTPNKKKYAVAGGALGGLLGIVISFVAITWRKLVK